MDTTVIIIALGALILIVVIAIVVVLIKGKKDEGEDSSTGSDMTFQEESDTPKKAPVEAQLNKPKLHQSPQNQPTQPPMQDLSQPKQSTPVAQATKPQNPPTRQPQPQKPLQQKPQQTPPIQQAKPQSTQQKSNEMYAPNPLPDKSKMQNDMENLVKAQRQPNTAPLTPQQMNKGVETPNPATNAPQQPSQPVKQASPQQQTNTPQA